ncbi:MAG: tetratricopeptide repeat protein [Leptospiraceae bacterium]|nr:tetratricopeptide repeat protein [Leptospiraceae bacterium]
MKFFVDSTKIAINLERSKDFTRAFNAYQKALSLTQNQTTIIKIRSKQAWCLHQVGNPLETEKIYQDLLDEFPDNPWGSILYAKYLIKTRRWKAAKALLSLASKHFPDNLELYLTHASLLKDMERSNEAIEILKKALAQVSLTKGRGIMRKDIWAELGSLFFQRGDYNSSISALKKSLLMDNESSFLHYDILGICYLLVGDHENCIHFIDKYIHYNGEIDTEILKIKARAHARAGVHHLATASLLQAYALEDRLNLDAEDMIDLAPLKQLGFLDTLENLEIEE